jgi:mono/diheme cytochrome c family protein
MMNVSFATPSLSHKAARAIALGLMLLGAAGAAQAANPRNGAKVYGERCADCHGNRGVPTMPGVPDFSRNERLMQSDLTLVKSISIGKGMMPAFQGVLSEQDILDVIAYLRTLQ